MEINFNSSGTIRKSFDNFKENTTRSQMKTDSERSIFDAIDRNKDGVIQKYELQAISSKSEVKKEESNSENNKVEYNSNGTLAKSVIKDSNGTTTTYYDDSGIKEYEVLNASDGSTIETKYSTETLKPESKTVIKGAITTSYEYSDEQGFRAVKESKSKGGGSQKKQLGVMMGIT